MTVNNPPIFDHIIATTGENVKCLVQAIGAWNMDVDASKAVTMPIQPQDVRILGFSVMIRNDVDANKIFSLGYSNDTAGGSIFGFPFDWNGTTLTLLRKVAGGFDSASFSSVLISRGDILVWYV